MGDLRNFLTRAGKDGSKMQMRFATKPVSADYTGRHYTRPINETINETVNETYQRDLSTRRTYRCIREKTPTSVLVSIHTPNKGRRLVVI